MPRQTPLPIKVIKKPSLATTLQGVYFTFYIFLPLYVSALASHLQVEYTVIPMLPLRKSGVK
jgi:hypothetical protein